MTVNNILRFITVLLSKFGFLDYQEKILNNWPTYHLLSSKKQKVFSTSPSNALFWVPTRLLYAPAGGCSPTPPRQTHCAPVPAVTHGEVPAFSTRFFPGGERRLRLPLRVVPKDIGQTPSIYREFSLIT
jgi:hypothetical protein